MKSLTRWVRRSMFKSLHKSFNVVVIVALLLQPVGTVGVYGAFSFSRGVPIATAVETEPATPAVDAPADVTPPKEEVVAPVEEIKPVVEEKVVPPVTTSPETPASIPPVTPAETPILTPSIGDTGATTENTEALPATTEETSATSQETPSVDAIAPLVDTTSVSADSATVTPEASVLPKETWATDGNKSVTNDPVELGKAYVAPKNAEVSITFTKLPENPGTLSIEEITLTDAQVASLGALSNKAYDITSTMENGTFEYDLTLPKAESEKDVQIKFAEDVAGLENATVVPSSDIDESNDNVSATFDHFTVFVVVNPNGQVSCDAIQLGTTPGTTCFQTIQAAIAAAGSGDTIKVAAGTYTEVGQIVIDKDLTIIGADKTTTIIKPAQDTGNSGSGDARGWFLTSAGITFNMSDVTLDGVGKNICHGIYDYSLGTIQDINVKNIGCEQYYGRAIYLKNNATIRNVRFENIARIGVFVWQGATAAVIDGNTYVGKGAGDHLDYGIELGNGGVATITNNTISNNTGVASTTDGSTSAGILATTFFGPGTQATITGNTITGNTDGVAVGFNASDASVVVAHNNNLSGNTIGVGSTHPTVDASGNWWGSNNPATVKAQANGGLLVDYTPWLNSGTDTAPGTAGFQGDFSFLNVDDDSLQTGATGRIQEGINLVSGSTVNVVAGTYTEHVAVNTSVNLMGANAGIAGNAARGAESIVNGASGSFTLEADDIVLDGFIIQDATSGPGIETKPTFSGYHIRNNIIKNNVFGIYLHSEGTTQTVVNRNLFDSNNNPGSANGNGIYSDQGIKKVLIDSNKFTGDLGASVNISFAGPDGSDVTISNNEMTGEGAIFAIEVGTLNITGNTITNPLNHGMQLTGNNDVTIADNTITNVTDGWSAIRLGNSSLAGDSNSDVTITGNTITGSATGLGINVGSEGNALFDTLQVHRNAITGHDIGVINNSELQTIDATCNWWGAANGPGPVGTGSGSLVTTGVTFEPWLTSGNLDGLCNGTSTVTVTIDKFIDGVQATATSANNTAFPMSATWNAVNIGAGSGSFDLDADGFNGNPTPYQAITSPMTQGASYTTSEITSGSNVGTSCREGKPFVLVGYTSGETLSEAQLATPTTETIPDFTNLTSNKFVIVWNEHCAPAETVAASVTTTIHDADHNPVTSVPTGSIVHDSALVAGTSNITPFLGTAGTFGILSSTFTANGGLTAITGDAGYTTLSGSGTHTVTGVNQQPAPPQAGLDQATALATLNGQSCTFPFAPGAIDLASDTTHGPIGVYTPGVYCSTGAMNIGGGDTITLNGSGTYIFRSGGALDSTTGSIVAVTGGASAADVFWTPTGATTLGANSTFVGTDIDNAGITVGSTVAWEGRILAFEGTVTTNTDTIIVPTSSGPVPTGNVEFTFFSGPGADVCSVEAENVSAGTVALVNGIAHPSTSQGPLAAGNYAFQARYLGVGDGNYPNGAISACEPFTVTSVPVSEVKICKVDGNEDGLPDWNVFLKGDKAGNVSVLPTGITYSSSVFPTDDYILEANGTYTYRGTPGAEYTDANYSKRSPADSVYGGPYVPWVNVNTFPNPHTGWLGVMVDGSATNWSNYFNPVHQYVLGYPNHTGQFDFNILDDAYSDNSGSIPVDIYKGFAGTTGEDGCITFENVPLGTYTVGEVQQDGWDYVSGAGEVAVDDTQETFTLVNREVPKPVTVVVAKVICDNESDLPNRHDGADITSTTATDYVASHPSCHLVPDWNFQWGYDAVSNPGDAFVGPAGAGWNTFSPTVDISNPTGARLKFREVLPTGYIPFTYLLNGSTNVDNVSAEFYCGDDVVNYDNEEWLNTPQNGSTYYCVAWNVLKEGKIIVDKVTNPSEDPQSFHFNTTGTDYSSFDLTDGAVPNEQVLVAGTYSVSEEAVSGWDQTSATCVSSNQGDEETPASISLQPGETVTCTLNNTKNPPVHIVATKIVCTNESDLPNWGVVGTPNDITAITAQRWVNTHSSCSLVPNWQFEWGNDTVSNPGDGFTGPAENGWTTFGSTVDISTPPSWLKFREVLPEGYIPFSYLLNGSTNVNNVSAEFYCGDDVVNYDNEEWLFDTVPGNTYYCVAWNVKLESIHGFKWDDLNGNGQYDCNVIETAFVSIAPICEPKLPGWTINLYRWNGETYDTTPLQSMVTSSDGEELGWYWFKDLLPGKYQVCEESQSGWTQTFPGDPNCHEVTLPNDELRTKNSVSAPEYDFGNVHFGTITVTKYEDSNGNGTRDEGEATLPEWDMHLSQGEPFSRTQSTDGSGQTTFDDFLSGTYALSEPGVEGWTLTNISCTNDRREEDTFRETAIIDNSNDHSVSVLAGETVNCEVGNMHTPRLSIEKWNDSTSTQHPGDTVRYHIRVTAHDNDVKGVSVTDLPSAGFVYAHGSAIADQGGLTHEYASPGIWTLGDMTAGQSIELAYDATISGTQDAGNYRDLAYATGNSEANTGENPDVIAEDPIDSDNFVGTEVAVALPTSLAVQLDEKTKTKTETHKKIKQVLGASTLPATGANSLWMALAIAMLALGLGMILLARRKKAMTMNNSNGMIMKTLLLFILSVSVFTLPSMASAANPNISVRIETPKAVVSSPDFKIGFVVLDISNDTPDVACEVNNGGGLTSFPAAHIEYTAQAGGNSGNCVVDATVMPVDGGYTFRVTADDSVSSDEVPVTLVSATPSTPLNYNREKNSCGVSFMTANDGLTTGVELYRSTESSFVADASTLATTLAIAPNTNGAMIDPGADCRDYFYAIRAVSASGAGSGFVGDDNVNVKYKTKTKTVIETIAGPSTGGAIPVTSGGTTVGGEVVTPGTEGSVQGAETENLSGENGSVLGEETTAAGSSSWISSHPWWSALIALIVLVLGYFGYQAYQKKRNEQPLQ